MNSQKEQFKPSSAHCVGQCVKKLRRQHDKKNPETYYDLESTSSKFNDLCDMREFKEVLEDLAITIQSLYNTFNEAYDKCAKDISDSENKLPKETCIYMDPVSLAIPVRFHVCTKSKEKLICKKIVLEAHGETMYLKKRLSKKSKNADILYDLEEDEPIRTAIITAGATEAITSVADDCQCLMDESAQKDFDTPQIQYKCPICNSTVATTLSTDIMNEKYFSCESYGPEESKSVEKRPVQTDTSDIMHYSKTNVGEKTSQSIQTNPNESEIGQIIHSIAQDESPKEDKMAEEKKLEGPDNVEDKPTKVTIQEPSKDDEAEDEIEKPVKIADNVERASILPPLPIIPTEVTSDEVVTESDITKNDNTSEKGISEKDISDKFISDDSIDLDKQSEEELIEILKADEEDAQPHEAAYKTINDYATTDKKEIEYYADPDIEQPSTSAKTTGATQTDLGLDSGHRKRKTLRNDILDNLRSLFDNDYAKKHSNYTDKDKAILENALRQMLIKDYTPEMNDSLVSDLKYLFSHFSETQRINDYSLPQVIDRDTLDTFRFILDPKSEIAPKNRYLKRDQEKMLEIITKILQAPNLISTDIDETMRTNLIQQFRQIFFSKGMFKSGSIVSHEAEKP